MSYSTGLKPPLLNSNSTSTILFSSRDHKLVDGVFEGVCRLVEDSARIGNYSFGIGRLVGDLLEGYVMSFEDWEMGSDKARYI